MIEVSHLTKRYGDKYAVNDISFTVNDGEILGFLGPNGAGKSTTMNMLTGYLSSNEGSIKIAGIDILEDPNAAKKHIGYLPELPPLYLDMTVKEYLNFIYDLKGCKLNRKAHIMEICNLVKITNVYKRVIKNLSKGYRQRVGLAQALIGNPDVLILDEPTVGLDPKQIIEIRSLIKHLGKKHTVILSSHILSEVQSVCERVIIINHGKIVADDTEVNLSHNIQKQHRIIVRVAGPEEPVMNALSGLTGVKKITPLGQKEPNSYDFQIECEQGKDIRRGMFTVLSDRKWPILSLDSGEMTLEDIFLKLTSEDSVQFQKKKKKTVTAANADEEGEK
ncbi:ABC transporter [[Clostridium] cellulosi]|uniref:ABC transporter n=1 Tax=[Clostridium] cellulosi TaxID=29343 RepID=A0A078KQK8_9FIRM|nr:MAG: ABC transporter [[Clostridium] cellulosi]CDZ23384.1 ABC transporter [[Clostridium] cellulosi]